MSEKTIYSCDACGAELGDYGDYDPLEQRIHLPVGLDSDPAGGASTTDYRRIDLCQLCLAKAVNEILNKRCSWEYNLAIMDRLTSVKHKFTLNIENMDLGGNKIK